MYLSFSKLGLSFTHVLLSQPHFGLLKLDALASSTRAAHEQESHHEHQRG
jgi:hypothetical protein